MNQQIHPSVFSKTLVVYVTGQAVAQHSPSVLDEAPWLTEKGQPALVLLDLSALGGLVGLTTIYRQMADAVRNTPESGAGFYPIHCQHDTSWVVVQTR